LRSLADVTLGGPAANNFRGDEVTSQRARIAPYAVKTVAGQKIGFVGATTWELLVKSSPNGTRPMDDGNVATSDLQEVAAYVQTAVDALRAIGVNKIIMLDQLDTLQRNKDLAPLLTGVDVMVAGGGHERMGDANDVAVGFNGHDADFIADSYPIVSQGLDGKPTLIVTTDTEYSYLGRLVVDFDANGELVMGSLNPVVNGAYAAAPAVLESVVGNGQTAAQIVAASPVATRVKAIVDALNAVVVSKDSAVFGFTKVYLEGDRVFGRAQEVNLGNITADANAQAARVALGLPTTAPVVSLKNGGGLRASLGAVAADWFAATSGDSVLGQSSRPHRPNAAPAHRTDPVSHPTAAAASGRR
jgi:2',3'-cyclic-nucleotide 2'-phosphodiesterase (5'-nucleotidase family)